MFDIFTHKTDAMQRLQHLASHSYKNWISGTVHPKKLEALCLKFSDRYEVNRSDMQRYRAKAKAQSNTKLVLFMSSDDEIYWWLLATPGEGLIHHLEKLTDASEKGQRITWPACDYELIKMPRKNANASWTWRMTSKCLEAWQERLRGAIRRHSDDQIRQALFSLRRVPGFRESRKQAFSLEKMAKLEWKRSRKGDWPYPGLFVGFKGRHKKAETIPLAKIVTQAKRKPKTQPIL